jgi:hypothetical protein
VLADPFLALIHHGRDLGGERAPLGVGDLGKLV